MQSHIPGMPCTDVLKVYFLIKKQKQDNHIFHRLRQAVVRWREKRICGPVLF